MTATRPTVRSVTDFDPTTVTVVDAIDAYATDCGAAAISWEGWSVGDTPRRHGFSALTAALNRCVGEPGTGFVRWLAGTASEPRHYRQTTHVTCGAVCVPIADAALEEMPIMDNGRCRAAVVIGRAGSSL